MIQVQGLISGRMFAAAGFALMGIAATLGSLKFAQSRPSSNVTSLHKMFTEWSAFAGTSLVAAGFYLRTSDDMGALVHLTVGESCAVRCVDVVLGVL